MFIASNIFIGFPYGVIPSKRLKVQKHGTDSLVVCAISAVLSVGLHIWIGVNTIPGNIWAFITSAIWCVAALSYLFWNGIISVYCTSVQLGIKIRVIGILCGWIPVLNVFILYKIISICRKEIYFETEKHLLNESRKADLICSTKYPILLVHGVFFRDFKKLNYWGRIPGELTKNGAAIFYGEHQSAASVADSAEELTARIRRIVIDTGCEKVNIIAHSKGGLDCRYAIANGADSMVASLTTINTPHRGCGFADNLIEKVPASVREKIARTYNTAAKKLGDKTPDFLAAVIDLTAQTCSEFDRNTPLPQGIFCQSVGSELKKATGGKFPMNVSYNLVRHFDGPNDGLVAESSFRWGENYIYLTPTHKRGISHADVIDLNRENIPGFDVREFYVQLVSDLKKRGL